jgi:hypothetical protein
MRWIATLAARLRQAWLLRFLSSVNPPCLEFTDRRYWSPLVQAVVGGCPKCVEIALQHSRSKTEFATWLAADWAFYAHRWKVLEYLVHVYGPNVLRDHTVTAWLHMIHLESCPVPLADAFKSQVPRPDCGFESAVDLHAMLRG